MAERRMFSKKIIGSARFLRMPPSSRLLYYDLGMYADDDGVVEAFSVMRQTGATEDDLRVLVSKGFVTVLNEDLVSFIMDWSVNNSIRKDRYHASIYKDLVLQLTDGIPSDNQVATIGIPRLGKDSIGKDSTDNTNNNYSYNSDSKKSKKFIPPTVAEVSAYIAEKDYRIDAESFIDFYQSKGWKVGKEKMIDWKAAVRGWERRRKENAGENVRTNNRANDSQRRGASGAVGRSGTSPEIVGATVPRMGLRFEEEE